VCLSTGPRWPGGPHLPAKNNFTMDFCLCGAILNLKAFCFGAIPDIMIELIALLECATKQAVMTVAQWHRSQIIRGLWLLAKKKLKMDSCLRGAILNLAAFCSIWTLIEECSSIK